MFIGVKAVKFVVMVTLSEKKQRAYQLFVASTLNRKEIATQIGITEKTLRGWIEAGDWETIRNSRLITQPELRKNAYAQLAALQKEIAEKHNNVPPKAVSDALSSVLRQIELLSDQPLFRYIEVLDDFTNWMSTHNPQQLKLMAVHLHEYTQSIAKRKGL